MKIDDFEINGKIVTVGDWDADEIHINDHTNLTVTAPLSLDDTVLSIDESALLSNNSIDTEVLYNDSNQFEGNPNFTYDYNSSILTINSISLSNNIISSSSNGINIEDAGTEDAGININGTTYSVGLRINDIGNNAPAELVIHKHSTSLPSAIIGTRSNSTDSTHSAVTSSQQILRLASAGWTGTHYDIFADIVFKADSSGTISSTSSPGRIELRTTADGSNSQTTALTIDSSQEVTLANALGIASGGTGQTTANAAFNALVPSQSGNSGKYLTTDGTDTSWASAASSASVVEVPFTSQTSVNVAHNLGVFPVVQTLDASDNLFIPLSIVHNTSNDFTVTFSASKTGTILYMSSAAGIPGGGDVVGPASSTDNAVVRFDGAGGKTLQNSGVIINDSNNIGVGTTPLQEIHIYGDDSPAIRFEQSNVSFSPYIWELAGNETNFFIRDVTNSSTIPFKVLDTATTNTLVLDTGRVAFGIGVASYQAHIFNNSTSTDPRIYIEQSGTGDASMAFDAGAQIITIGVDNSDSDRWKISDNSALGTNDRLYIETTGEVTITNALSVTDNIDCYGIDYDYVIYEDQQTTSTAGGSSSAATWNTRTLNTVEAEKDDSGSFSALSSNQFTLQAGRYRLIAQAPAHRVNRHKLRILNATDTTVALVGTSAYAANAVSSDVQSLTTVQGEIDIASAKTFQVDHYTQSAFSGNGLGVETSASGHSEVYAQIFIMRLGD